MSDWRSGNNKDGMGRKESRPKPKPLPPAKPNANDSSSVPPGPSTDWRGNAKKRTVASKPQDRPWTGRGREKTASISGLKKAFLLSGLGLAIAFLFYSYWVFVFDHDPRLPVVISIAADYTTLDLGGNSFGTQSFEFKQKKLHLFPASHKLANSEPFKLKADEQFLNEIKTNDTWGRTWSGFENYRTGTVLGGGGPSKLVTAYFISCMIARESAPVIGTVVNSGEASNANQWVLLTKDDDPFKQSNGDKITISKLFERIARQTADGSYALVVMDVKPPAVVANLGDLEFPQKTFEKAFEGLSPELKHRLVVCLPCDEGQESWIAPEFSSSVFAHFFWKGVTTGFDNSRRKWSILDFQKSLKDQVSNWVARYRYAKQMPTFLMSNATEGRIKDVQLVETTGGAVDAQSGSNLKSILKERFSSLEGLWEEYATLQHCVYSNPLRHATMESGLIQMEDVVEYANEATWKEFESRIKEHIRKLKDLSKFDRRVSLVEAKQYSEFLRDRSVFNDQVDSKCLAAWNGLEKAAKSDDKQIWTKAFSKMELRQAIDQCALDPERISVEWIEVRLLKLVHEAIGDEAENPKAVEAIAGLFKMYSELNTIAFQPRLELSRWTAKKVIALDKLFSECFDHFFAAEFDACIEKLRSLQTGFLALSEEFESLKKAMTTRDEVLWLVPHLLASQMRMSRHVNSNDAKSLFASDIGSLLQDAISIRDSLEDDQATFGTLSLKPDAGKKLEELTNRLKEVFTKTASKAETDPGTLPMSRIALRWPLLPKDLRSKLHNQLVNLYEIKKTDGGNSEATNNDWSSLTPSSVGGEFLSNLLLAGSNLEVSGSYYERLVKNDPRYSISTINPDKDYSSGSTPVKQRIYRASYQTRMVANSFGQRATTTRPREELWPWNSPDQLQAVNEVLYNHLQAERLCIARWGDGDLDAPSAQGLYFERMLALKGSVSKSFNASPVQALKDFDQARSISPDLEASLTKLSDGAVAEVKRLGITVSPFGLNDDSPVSLTLAPNSLDALAAVSVHEDSKPERIRFSESSKTNSKSFQLNKDITHGESIEKLLKLDPKLVGKQLRLSVRGHYRKSPLREADGANTFSITMDRQIGSATVRVAAKDAEPITLWVLLDCSGSMVGIHEKAKATAKSLLLRVQELNHSGECPIDVGFIVFGREPGPDMPPLLVQSQIGNQIFRTEIMKGERIEKLVELVDDTWLKPSRCTPLYDAIFSATDKSKEDGSNWIVVISDGSNDLGDPLPANAPEKERDSYYISEAGKKTAVQLERRILESKSRLFIFQYKNDRYYKEARTRSDDEMFPQTKRDEIAKEDNRLKELYGKLTPDRKLFFSDFESLQQELLELLPRSTVDIVSDSRTVLKSGKLAERIGVEMVQPLNAVLRVQSYGQKQAKELPIWFSGGEKLEFNYSGTRGLTVIPYKNDPNGFGKSSKPMAADGGSKFKVAVKATTATTAPDRLDIQLSLRGMVDETIDQKTFTRRPSFVVASIRPTDSPLNQAFWVSDHSFRPATHYPILQLPYVPWQQDNQWHSEDVDMDVWMADEVPTSAFKVSLKPGDQEEVMESKFRCVRTKDQVTVSIPGATMDRYFVMCSRATKTVRDFLDGRETKIVFDVPSAQATEISIVKLSELQSWAADGTLQHFSVSELKFAK